MTSLGDRSPAQQYGTVAVLDNTASSARTENLDLAVISDRPQRSITPVLRASVDNPQRGLHSTDVVDQAGNVRPMSLTEVIGASAAMLSSAVALVLLGYFAFAIASVHSVVEKSLPCEPAVILDTDPIIDPAGYSQYSEAEVEASKAFDACMSASLALFASEGLTSRSNAMTWLLIIPADVLAALLLGTGWVIAVLGAPRLSVVMALLVLTVGSLIAVSFQFRFADTIELVSWITN